MSTDLAVADPAYELDRAADPGEFVVQCLERGKTWLSEALAHRDLEGLINLKGYAETLRVATIQKQLGHDAELSASELVRRAERSIGKAIRQGQEAGVIAKRGDVGGGGRGGAKAAESRRSQVDHLVSPKVLLANTAETKAVYAVTDGISDEDFEEAIEEAKAEGNLTRANVVRKVKPKKPTTSALIAEAAQANPAEPPRNMPLKDRADQIRALAAKNMTSPQIADEIGVSADRVRDIAKRAGIELAADAAFPGGFRKVDPNRIVESIIDLATPEPIALARIAYVDLDRDRIEDWVSSLDSAIKSLQTIKRNLTKELTRDQG